MNVSLEIRLFNFIRSLHQEITDMRPEDGFSSPRDLELVTEANKKSAVFDKLQEAMRIYNPDFEYEPKQEGQKDFSKNPRFDTNWKEKAIKFDEETFKEEYINNWIQISDVTNIETLMLPYEFNFKEGVAKEQQIPSIIQEIEKRNVNSNELFLFSIVDKNIISDQEYGNITYKQIYMLFKDHANLNIKALNVDELKDHYLMVLTKSNIKNGIRFLFKIEL